MGNDVLNRNLCSGERAAGTDIMVEQHIYISVSCVRRQFVFDSLDNLLVLGPLSALPHPFTISGCDVQSATGIHFS